MECCLFETFRWYLKWDVLFETFETFQTYHGGLLVWFFQMRLEMRCAIRNFWNFSNLSWSVAYLKLSDETWNKMCYLKLFKLVKSIMECCLLETFRWDLKWDVLLETFQTYHGGLLIWNFQMRLEMRCAIRNFWNLSNLIRRVAYWKLSDETWNEMCYLKLLKLFNPSQELLIWNFQMTFEMRYAIWNIWNVWNLKLLKHVMGAAYFKLSDQTWKKMWCSKHLKLETFQTFQIHQRDCLFETFRWGLKWDVLLETFETCQIYHGVLLIGNFQMRLEMRCAIWNFSNLSWSVAYLKLSDETWNEMCY